MKNHLKIVKPKQQTITITLIVNMYLIAYQVCHPATVIWSEYEESDKP